MSEDDDPHDICEEFKFKMLEGFLLPPEKTDTYLQMFIGDRHINPDKSIECQYTLDPGLIEEAIHQRILDMKDDGLCVKDSHEKKNKEGEWEFNILIGECED